MGVLEQVVQHVGVHRGLLGELLAEVVADDTLVALLPLGEIKGDLGEVPDDHAVLAVLFHPPAVGQEGVGIAVDGVRDLLDLGETAQVREDLAGLVLAVGEGCEVLGFPSRLRGGDGEFVGQAHADIRRSSHSYASPVW